MNLKWRAKFYRVENGCRLYHLDYAKVVVGYNGGVGDDSGNRLYNTPRIMAAMEYYEFQNASLHGLKLGGVWLLRSKPGYQR